MHRLDRCEITQTAYVLSVPSLSHLREYFEINLTSIWLRIKVAVINVCYRMNLSNPLFCLLPKMDIADIFCFCRHF